MKDAFIKLQISIILAGATGIFGKLISLNEALLVWYRMMLASLLFLLVLSVSKRLNRISFGDALRIGGVGLLLGLHWVFFYGSIKASNVSIGVVCFSLVGFFTAFLEPLINCHRVSFKEVVFSLLTLFGVVLIFHFDTRYRLGIGLGIISSALAALFTITNKKIGNNYSTSTMLLYEMVGGFIGLSCILPFYLRYFPVSTIVPGLLDFTYLLLLASVCTIGLHLLQIQVLKKISASEPYERWSNTPAAPLTSRSPSRNASRQEPAWGAAPATPQRRSSHLTAGTDWALPAQNSLTSPKP